MDAVKRQLVPYKVLMDLGRVIGHVAWEVTEVTSRSNLGRGKKDVVMNDEILASPYTGGCGRSLL